MLFTPGTILFGMVYVYLPFMLFPMTLGLSMVPRDLVDAARDLGASRLQIWREVELPLAMPGILIGMLLTFVLAVGAVAEAKILGGQSIIVITHDIEIAFTYAQNWPLGSALAVLLMLVVGGLTLAGIAPARPRPHPGAALSRRTRRSRPLDRLGLDRASSSCVIYLPVLCGALASLGKSRYFRFPVRAWSLDWWQRTARLARDRHPRPHLADDRRRRHRSSPWSSASSARSPSPATTGAAGACTRSSCCCRSSSRSRCWAWRCCSGSTPLGVPLSWQTAVFAHLVWIVPVVTLVMAIQVYGFDPALEEAAFDLGASRLQVLREVTLPILWPGIWSGALFAFLLSWGNFPLSLYTTGADTTVPEWLYAKMVAGYTPMVPALGTMSTLAAAAVLLLLGVTLRLLRRREAE